MSKTNKIKAIAERAFWSAVWVLVAGVSYEQFGLPLYYAVPLASGLSAVKSYVASKVGDKDSLDLTNASVVKPEVPTVLVP